MIRVATTEQAREIDRESQKTLSIPAHELMNNAGRKAVEIIQKLFPDKKTKIVILCGPGNNGGDGVVVFRELLGQNYSNTQCFLALPIKSDALHQQIKNINKKIPVLSGSLPKADVYIDALFGIGLSKDISGALATAILQINHSRSQGHSQTVSLDIPSGLDSDTGAVRGVAIQADHTITFGIRKVGQLIQEGPAVCGHLRCVDIGFPAAVVKKNTGTRFLFTHSDFLRTFPQRKNISNKSSYGHVKVWAGSPGMWGAAVLTTRAAYRVGSGYVSVESDEPYFSDLPEVLVERESPIDNKFCYAVGPGWGTGSHREQRLRALYQNQIENVVLDADALNTIAHASTPIPLRADWIITPHTKELSRLLKIRDTSTIEAHRTRHALQAAQNLGAVVLLKGFRTLVAVDNKVIIVSSGNAALAKAGSGDVLTGIIAGLRAQGLNAPLAALNGAYLHGWMSDLWAEKNHPNTLMPSDLLKGLPSLLQKLLQR